MSVHVFEHVSVPYASSLSSVSVEERIRPNLRRAYPLPRDDEARFRVLLDELARRTTGRSESVPSTFDRA